MGKTGAGRWVVYRMTRPNQAATGNVVCEQSEWEALDRARPGFHTLLHSGIGTEQEAERLARGTDGDVVPRAAEKAEGDTPAIPPPA